MAAQGELLPPLQYLHGMVAPEDGEGMGTAVLGVQGPAGGKVVVGAPGDVLALRREDEGVELPVGLKDAAAVDADDLPLPVHDRLRAGAVRAVKGHRPVPHHAVVGEGVTLGEEVVVFHALPGVQLFHVIVGGDAAVDEDIARGGEDGGEISEKVQLGGELLPQDNPQGGQVLRGGHGRADLHGHLSDEGALLPHAQVVAEEVPAQAGVLVHEVHRQIVAVAAQGVDGVGLGELHDIAQGSQAVGALFDEVAHQYQGVVGGKAHLVQQALQPGQVSVDVADRQQPSVGGKGDGADHRLHGSGPPFHRLWDVQKRAA